MDALKDKFHGNNQAKEMIFLLHKGEKGPKEARLAKTTIKSS